MEKPIGLENANAPELTDCERSLQSGSYGSTKELFKDVCDLLALHPGLREIAAQKLAYFAVAILFADCVTSWPFVTVVAPAAVASTLLLNLVKCVSLSPLHVGDVTLNTLLQMQFSSREVLLIDQPVPNRQLERALRALSRPGANVIRKSEFREAFCPALLCSAEPLSDPWLLKQAIQISLMPTRHSTHRFDLQSLHDATATLREKLRHYREANLAAVKSSRFDAAEFRSPTREIASMLGRCVVDDAELQQAVIALFREDELDARVSGSYSISAVEIEALLFLCHEVDRQQVRIGGIAATTTGIFTGRGENIEIEPRAVGDHLRSLGLFSRRLGSAGRGIDLTNEIRRQIHELAWRYDVLAIREGPDRCPLCTEARVCFANS